MKLITQNVGNPANDFMIPSWRKKNTKSFNMQKPELLLLPHTKQELLVLKWLSFDMLNVNKKLLVIRKLWKYKTHDTEKAKIVLFLSRFLVIGKS